MKIEFKNGFVVIDGIETMIPEEANEILAEA
jgi:hypothetical protein